MTDRRGELAQRLRSVRAAIAEACASVGRDPDAVVLVAVSKTWPAEDVAALHDLGVHDFGENRLPELQSKAAALADRDLRWHFLGQIQSKKAGGIGRIAPVIHSVDRRRIVAGLGAGARDVGRRAEVFLQVSLAEFAPSAEAAGRGGAQPADLSELAAAVGQEPNLRLAGVMTLPPRSADPDAVFARLAEISAQLRRDYPAATAISAGMSHDYPAAIRAGATHVRIGSALFGEREYVR